MGRWEAPRLQVPVCVLHILALVPGSSVQEAWAVLRTSTSLLPKAGAGGQHPRPTSSVSPSVLVDLNAWGWQASSQGRKEELTVTKEGEGKEKQGPGEPWVSVVWGNLDVSGTRISAWSKHRLQASAVTSDNLCASPSVLMVPSHRRSPLSGGHFFLFHGFPLTYMGKKKNHRWYSCSMSKPSKLTSLNVLFFKCVLYIECRLAAGGGGETGQRTHSWGQKPSA